MPPSASKIANAFVDRMAMNIIWPQLSSDSKENFRRAWQYSLNQELNGGRDTVGPRRPPVKVTIVEREDARLRVTTPVGTFLVEYDFDRSELRVMSATKQVYLRERIAIPPIKWTEQSQKASGRALGFESAPYVRSVWDGIAAGDDDEDDITPAAPPPPVRQRAPQLPAGWVESLATFVEGQKRTREELQPNNAVGPWSTSGTTVYRKSVDIGGWLAEHNVQGSVLAKALASARGSGLDELESAFGARSYNIISTSGHKWEVNGTVLSVTFNETVFYN